MPAAGASGTGAFAGGHPSVVAAGAGRMGRGIGHVFAYAGCPVRLLDLKPRAPAAFERLRAAALGEIEADMRFLAAEGIMRPAQVDAALALIEVAPAARAAEVLGGADLVIEGVPETAEAKAAALGRIGELAGPATMVASTTSTMLVTELQGYITGPQRFLNTHFLNPAYLIPLVEVSAGPQTDPAVADRVVAIFEAAGKVPVRCAAAPGYIIPRLQSLIMAECCRMVAEGVASVEDIDKAIVNGFGPRYATMGVMEFIDWGGLDILYYAGHYLSQALDSPRHAPPPEVDAMMRAGQRGMREGRGYYDFRDRDVEAYRREKLSRFVRLLDQLGRIPAPGV